MYSEAREEKTVVHVIVSSGPEKPCYLKKFGMTSEGCFLRVGSSKHSMTDKMKMEQFSSGKSSLLERFLLRVRT